jgi:hypothetical protein
MRITERQLLFLYQVLLDSLPISGSNSPFTYTQEQRKKIADDILNQQSNELKEG